MKKTATVSELKTSSLLLKPAKLESLYPTYNNSTPLIHRKILGEVKVLNSSPFNSIAPFVRTILADGGFNDSRCLLMSCNVYCCELLQGILDGNLWWLSSLRAFPLAITHYITSPSRCQLSSGGVSRSVLGLYTCIYIDFYI